MTAWLITSLNVFKNGIFFIRCVPSLRNWCPHTITKTVTCQVQNGTVLQRVYQSCRWPQGCSGGSYKTVVRPSYKVVYRTVTSLEWKCCPGYSGAACEEGEWRRSDQTCSPQTKPAPLRPNLLPSDDSGLDIYLL
ncbi:EMI domain-containing protein 1 [Takifugu flavidus]|uniref:EMI domain-containing protein 1 n=1 Tax=Takifugu flavidus TaxID=433684 RepID=A0A5C6MZJ5_9TELE|nr:EMI domain-containing protein 1 [Takifugu flavidus]